MAKKIIIYCDGACSGNPGPAGFGVVVVDGCVRIQHAEFLGKATNNKAELQAVIYALELCYRRYNKNRVTIYTDSIYVINALENKFKPTKNRELIYKAKHLLRQVYVILQHVKGHSGNVYNELADSLAKQAIPRY